MFLIEDAVQGPTGHLFLTDADVLAATENEACLSGQDMDECGGECEACESRYTSVVEFSSTGDCDDCVYTWEDAHGYWAVAYACRACGEEDAMLTAAGL